MATQQFQIEKNVPIPQANAFGRNAKYPFRQMEVGDSFFASDTTVQKMSNNACGYKARGHGTFTCRAVDGGVRVWRIA